MHGHMNVKVGNIFSQVRRTWHYSLVAQNYYFLQRRPTGSRRLNSDRSSYCPSLMRYVGEEPLA